MRNPNFVFLVMREHPFGREMLFQLLQAGFEPRLIIEEDSQIAAAEREKFLKRISGHKENRPVADQASERGIPIVAVSIHKDAHCMPHIRAVEPELIVLGGTRIIRGDILTYPRGGVLNAHPGLLPECRGSASPAWSVYHDIPIGSSCHFCTSGIDEGDVIGRRRVSVYRGDTYEDLCFKTLIMAGTLMTEAVRAYSEGRLDEIREIQGESPHPTFRNMPDDLITFVHQKLRDQTYAHYAD